MSEISDAALAAALRHQMTVAAARQVVSAGNLANASTPGFKARELDFARTLDSAFSMLFSSIRSRHSCFHPLQRKVGPRWWEHTAELPQYVLHMRGNTCVKVEFPNRGKFTQAEPVYPVFQRDGFRTGPTPMKKTVRYVPTKLVPW